MQFQSRLGNLVLGAFGIIFTSKVFNRVLHNNASVIVHAAIVCTVVSKKRHINAGFHRRTSKRKSVILLP